jgi:hypothetical protein
MVAAAALVVALVSLAVSSWTAMTVARQETRLRELAEGLRDRIVGPVGVSELPMHAPPPELENKP